MKNTITVEFDTDTLTTRSDDELKTLHNAATAAHTFTGSDHTARCVELIEGEIAKRWRTGRTVTSAEAPATGVVMDETFGLFRHMSPRATRDQNIASHDMITRAMRAHQQYG